MLFSSKASRAALSIAFTVEGFVRDDVGSLLRKVSWERGHVCVVLTWLHTPQGYL